MADKLSLYSIKLDINTQNDTRVNNGISVCHNHNVLITMMTF